MVQYEDQNPVVLALPRGGVVVGLEVAKKLHCPMGVIVVRKLGVPKNPEFGIGAIAEGGIHIIDQGTIDILDFGKTEVEQVVANEIQELKRRVEDRITIIVDDGLARGLTAIASIAAVKKLHPRKIVLALPVCSEDTALRIKNLVDDLVCLITPEDMSAIGMWYQKFDQVTDQQVKEALSEAEKIYQAEELIKHKRHFA